MAHVLTTGSLPRGIFRKQLRASGQAMNLLNVHFTDYKVLEADSGEELTRQVTFAIHNRWQPFGGMSVVKTNDGSKESLRLFQPIAQQAEWFR